MTEPAKATTTVFINRHLKASQEQAFNAWLDPEQAKRFLFATPKGKMVRAEIDAREGGTFLFVDQREGEDIEHTGMYLTINRPRILAFAFTVPKFTSEMTKVTISLSPAKKGCELALKHEGVWADFATRTEQGWNMIIDGLEKTLEHGSR